MHSYTESLFLFHCLHLSCLKMGTNEVHFSLQRERNKPNWTDFEEWDKDCKRTEQGNYYLGHSLLGLGWKLRVDLLYPEQAVAT